jgi:hypothetical protein
MEGCDLLTSSKNLFFKASRSGARAWQEKSGLTPQRLFAVDPKAPLVWLTDTCSSYIVLRQVANYACYSTWKDISQGLFVNSVILVLNLSFLIESMASHCTTADSI